MISIGKILKSKTILIWIWLLYIIREIYNFYNIWIILLIGQINKIIKNLLDLDLF
jgi:hypothetical protein